MDVRFGVHAGLQHTTIAELRELWARIETLGFDWISIWDHFYAADATGDPHCLEAITSHTALAMSTTKRHVRLTRVLRRLPPPRGARQRDGDARPDRRRPHRARPRRRLAAERVRRVRDALRQRRANGFACSRSTCSACAVCSRRNARRSRASSSSSPTRSANRSRCRRGCPIWIGGGGEKVTLRIAAQYADGWNVPFIAPEEWAHKAQVLDEHCAAVGRDPAEIVEDGQRRHGVHRRGAAAPVRPRCRTT